VLVDSPSLREVAVDLVHALEPADDQALQVQLRSDAQVHVEIERIGDACGRGGGAGAAGIAASPRLDLEKIERIEKVAQ